MATDNTDIHFAPLTWLEVCGGVKLFGGFEHPASACGFPDSCNVKDGVNFSLTSFDKGLFFDALGAEVETTVSAGDFELKLCGEVFDRLFVNEDSLVIGFGACAFEHALLYCPCASSDYFPSFERFSVEDFIVSSDEGDEREHELILDEFLRLM